MKSKLKNKGLTLLELIISLAILSIIIIPISSMTLSATKINVKSEEKLNAVSLAQECMEYAKDPSHTISDIESKINEINASNTKYSVKPVIKNVEDGTILNNYQAEIEISGDNKISFPNYQKHGGNFNSPQHTDISGDYPLNIELNNHGNGNKWGDLELEQSRGIGNSKNHGKINKIEVEEDVKISIKLDGDNPKKISLTNNVNKKLVVYVSGKSVSKDMFDLNGNVEIKYASFYSVGIEVSKKGEPDKPLQILEGYKIIYN